MANARGKSIDSTFLNTELAAHRELIHRDYIGHINRFSHALRHIKPNGVTRLFDAGCGRLAPMSKVLYANKYTSVKYFGVDVGPINVDIRFPGDFQPTFWPHTNVIDVSTTEVEKVLGGPATLVISYEVAEHQEPQDCVRFLRKLFDIACPDGELLISTPCFNGEAAGNHVNEWRYEAFGTTLEMCGFNIKAHYGVFASIRDYKPHLSPAELDIFERLSQFYDSNVLAVILSPLYPQYSRNVLWHLTTKANATSDAKTSWRIDLYDAWQKRALGSSVNEMAWIEYGKAFGFC